MSKYAVYASSRIYHPMRDQEHTECGVYVNSGGHSQGPWAVLQIVESIPAGLRLCQHCADESSKKKGSKR